MSARMNRPKVLLVGSGVLQAYNGMSWEKYLESISNEEKRKGMIKRLTDEKCPSPLQAIILTEDHVDEKLKSKKKVFLDPDVNLDCYELLRGFLRVGFDEILTTNYTYELEAASLSSPQITEYRLRKMRRDTQENAKLRYLIHTYNSVPFEDKENRIWHIHGEHRKPSSIVLGHYYYGNLLCEIKEEIKRIDRNRWGTDTEKCTRGVSWLDSFLFGDIYCVGFGFSVYEFDLWWLLNRKAREKENTGKMYFYEPKAKNFGHRMELFKTMKDYYGENLVQVIDLDFEIDDQNKNESFQTFYLKILDS